jgi:hypothetical protein
MKSKRRAMATRIKYSDSFELRKRDDDGKEFVFVNEDYDSDLFALIFDIHMSFGLSCEDWIYREIYNAFHILEFDISFQPEVCKSFEEVYSWFNDALPVSQFLCDEVLEKRLCKSKSIMDIIICGEQLGLERIYNNVRKFIQLKNKNKE